MANQSKLEFIENSVIENIPKKSFEFKDIDNINKYKKRQLHNKLYILRHISINI